MLKAMTIRQQKRCSLLCAFFGTIILFSIVALVEQITPFGNQTFIYGDMKRQYIDFLAYYQSAFRSKNDFLYTFSMGLGAEMPCFSARYLASPFLIPLFIIPRFFLPVAITGLIFFKIALSAFTMQIYFNSMIREEDEFEDTYLAICMVPFSISFAMGSFMLENLTRVQWMDPVLLMPIVFLFLRRLLQGKGIWGYLITTAIMIYTNYPVAFIILFIVVGWGMKEIILSGTIKGSKRNLLHLVGKWAVCTLGAISINAFILVPALKELIRNGGSLVATSTGQSQNAPYQLLYAGALVGVFAVLFFFNKSITIGERVGQAILMGWLLLGVFFLSHTPICAMLGFGEQEYPQAILLVFLIVASAGRCLKGFSEGMTTRRMLLGGVIIYVAAGFWIAGAKPQVEGKVILAAMGYIAFIFAMLFAGLFVIRRREKHRGTRQSLPFVFLAILSLLQMVDLGNNAARIYHRDSVEQCTESTYTGSVMRIGNTLQALKTTNQGIASVRIENAAPREINDSMMFSYNGIGNYRAKETPEILAFLQNAGYADDGQYTAYTVENTESIESFLGLRYILSDSAAPHEEYARVESSALPTMKALSIPTYMNLNALPLSYGIKRETSQLTMPEAASPFAYIEGIYQAMTGKTELLFDEAKVKTVSSSDNSQKDATITTLEVTPAKNGDLYFALTFPEKGQHSYELYQDGKLIASCENMSSGKVMNLGHQYRNGTNEYTVKIFGEAQEVTPYFVTENIKALQAYYENIHPYAGEFVKARSSYLQMTIPASARAVMTTIPYEKCWRIRVNGEPVATRAAFGTFLCCDLPGSPAEDYVVEMTYIPEGFYAGMVVTLFTVFLLLMLFTKQFWRRQEYYPTGYKEKIK